MKPPLLQLSRRAASGFTLVEVITALVILAVATAIVLPVLSAMSSASTARASAGKLANFLNKRIALSASGGGPSEIILSPPSTVLAIVPDRADNDAQAAATVLGRYQLSSNAGARSAAGPSDVEAAEVLVLEGVTVDRLYVKSAATGETADTLSIRPGGECDDALFGLSCSGRTVWVNVRGLAGRARVYDSIPEYLAASFEVSDDARAASR